MSVCYLRGVVLGTKQTSLKKLFELEDRVKEINLTEQNSIDYNENRPV